MRRVRIPIFAMMVVIAFLALEMAALNVASEGWVDVSHHMTVLALAAATCMARYRKGDGNAWWFGFALFGWAYFALVLDSTARASPIVFRRTVVGLPPLAFLVLLMDWSGDSQGPIKMPLWWHRYDILQSIFTLVFAGIGGVICWTLSARRGAPYQSDDRRAGRLDFDGDEPEG
jgi:hypothetical protein